MSEDGHAAVEAVLTATLDSLPGTLREPARRIVAADGNRWRAGLLLAVAGRAWPGTSRRAATAAAAVELLHLAGQVHDDLLGEVPVRRGEPTVNAKEGTAVALLTGDALTGLALKLGADTGTAAALAGALVDVSVGRALAADNRFHADLPAGTALRIAELRTGALAATATRLGAVVTGAPEDGLHTYGLALGTALHLLDDVLDLVSGEAGSPPGIPATLAVVDDLLQEAATARPDLADLAERHRGSRLALVLPRCRHLLSS